MAEKEKDLQEEQDIKETEATENKEEGTVEEAVKTDTEEAGETSEETSEEASEEISEEAGEEETIEETSEENTEEDKKEKKRHFKSDKKQDKLKEQLAELNDKVVRQMAEFDNYRKRTEKEKQAMFETGARSVIEKLLPIVDNFERGLAGLKEGEEHTAFEEGMLMVYKQLMTELEKLEVKPLDAAGKEFDPNLHNAVMHVDDESLGENIVVEELQKGYTYRDTVVRHSMVKVAN